MNAFASLFPFYKHGSFFIAAFIAEWHPGNNYCHRCGWICNDARTMRSPLRNANSLDYFAWFEHSNRSHEKKLGRWINRENHFHIVDAPVLKMSLFSSQRKYHSLRNEKATVKQLKQYAWFEWRCNSSKYCTNRVVISKSLKSNCLNMAIATSLRPWINQSNWLNQ